MTKQLLIVDNDDQSEAIDKINTLVKDRKFKINCLQFNVGLPDGNDVVNEDGRIDMQLVRAKYEKEFSTRRFHLIAFDFKLNEPEGGIDGVSLIKHFNGIGKTKRAKKILYSSELEGIVEEYLNDYKENSNYERAWSKFKTLINLEILDFCKREDYEKKSIGFIEKISEQEDDFILEELRGNKGLLFSPALEVYQGLNFGQIADRIETGDPLSLKFKKKLIELAVAHISDLKMENKRLQIVFPKDETTDFLEAIPNYIKEQTNTIITLHRIETVSDHLNFLEHSEEILPIAEPIIFMGHGMSNALSGASIGSMSYGPFISEAELSVFSKRKTLLLTCRSNEYLNKFGSECGLKAGIGFPNMITDPYELLYPDEPERIEREGGIEQKDIDIFKSVIVDTIKYSLFDFVSSNLSFHELFKRIKLRAQKSLLNFYSENPNSCPLPLGRMLYDFNDGINFIGN